jgi:hypothetical protein
MIETFLTGEEVEIIHREGDASVITDMAGNSILRVEKDNGESLNIQLLDKDNNPVGAACLPKKMLRRKIKYVN